ncbi:FtsX-like permease family protein [Solirubrobacter soli]|uniref:FtsX-like permease family protein n=1 Tax=Solirubrobacter soli TaxID=363832 RepID=UPI000408D4B6|nr:FtsX-like permease family protein [Solirubrobacter soli]
MPRLRHRRAALFATLVAVALGAALASACGGLFETALRLDAPPSPRLAAYDAIVAPAEHATLAAGDGKPAQQVTLTERGTLPAGTLDAVRATPGVTRADELRDLGAIGVKTRDVAALRARVAGAGEAAAAGGGDVAARGGDIAARGGQAAAAGGATVLTGDARGRAEAVGVAGARIKLVLLSAIFGGLALIVMAILLVTIVSLAVEQRQRELTLLRTVGATPRQVRRLVVKATTRPALLAAVAGALAGPALAKLLFARIQDGGVVPEVLALRQSGIGILAGALGAFLITRVAVGLAARKAAKAKVGAALGEVEELPGTLHPARVAAAEVCAAGALTCAGVTLFMSPENAAATGGGTALGGALAAALVAPRLIERLAAKVRPKHAPGQLAVLNVRARAHRNAALVIPVILVASIALANIYQQTTQQNAVEHARAKDVPKGAEFISTAGWVEQPVDRSHRIDPWPVIGTGDEVAIPSRIEAKPGQTIGLVLGDGAHVRVKVDRVLEGSSRNRAILLPRALLAAHAGPARSEPPQVDVWITFAVVSVILAYAALSLINALVAALTGRRRELALLHLAGATTRQIRRMLHAEALTIAAIGTVTGTAIAIAGLIPLAIATAGSPLPSGPVWVFAATLAVIAALVLIPTFVVARTLNLKVNDVEMA